MQVGLAGWAGRLHSILIFICGGWPIMGGRVALQAWPGLQPERVPGVERCGQVPSETVGDRQVGQPDRGQCQLCLRDVPAGTATSTGPRIQWLAGSSRASVRAGLANRALPPRVSTWHAANGVRDPVVTAAVVQDQHRPGGRGLGLRAFELLGEVRPVVQVDVAHTHAVAVKRRYESAHRQEQARQTRRAILDAAAALFVEPGYAATPLTAIAAEGGVAIQTVYKVFGGKQALLSALVDVTVAGAA